MSKPFRDIGDRLRWHRTLMEMTQQDYATQAGLRRAQLGNWETGEQRLSLDGGLALLNTYGLSLDFIFVGNADMLPISLRKALLENPIDKNFK